MKYLIIDTWNGEGYSDSNVTIVETEDFNTAVSKSIATAMYNTSINKVRVKVTKFGDKRKFVLGYDIGEDSGLEVLMPMPENLMGVVLKPLINDYELVTNHLKWEWYINNVKRESLEYEDGDGIFNTIHHSVGEDDIILCSFEDPEMAMEYVDGDGVSFEIWKDKYSGKEYEVPISIERDWTKKEVK